MESERSSRGTVRNYCTLFDFHFLSRGLALYESLVEHSSAPFRLFVLAMDEECHRALSALQLPHVTIVHLDREFMNEDLRQARANREWREFCWTCSAALIRHALDRFELPQVTYLDADICFYADPEPVARELKPEESALITEHFYHPRHDQTESSGRFCVQFVIFNNNEVGRAVLSRWYRQCLEFCGLDPARGYCGDQKYLDEWPEMYPHVRITGHRGAGVAPWNIERFRVRSSGSKLTIDSGDGSFDLVFFHFHGLRIHASGMVQWSGARYHMASEVIERVYLPYFDRLKRSAAMLAGVGFRATHAMDPGSAPRPGLRARSRNWITGNRNFPAFVEGFRNRECPVCQSGQTRMCRVGLYDDRYGYPKAFALHECLQCHHRFLGANFHSEELSGLYTKYYPRSDFRLEDFAPFELQDGWKGWLLGEKSAAHAWVPARARVLDVGCGLGESLEFHRRRGSPAVGIEADANVRRVAEKFGLDIRIGVFQSEMLRGERFDAITLNQVLEHTADPITVIRDLQEHLAPGGRLILTVPNSFGWGAWLFGRRWIHWHVPYHLQFFSRESIRRLVAIVGGLEIEREECHTHSHWLAFQWSALVTFPKQGNRSAFWSKGEMGVAHKVMLRAGNVLQRSGVLALVTRAMDFLGVGDNRVVVLRRVGR